MSIHMEHKLLDKTVFKDGTVRQHDLRAPHSCGPNSCPVPLVELDQELCTLSLSPLTPYQFVVAGDGPYVGHSYDTHVAYLTPFRVTSMIADTRVLHWKSLGVESPERVKNSLRVSEDLVQSSP